MPDFTWKQGDTGPALLDSLTYSDGSAVDLTNASVSLVLRSLTAPGALTLTGTVRYTDRPNGGIAYQPSAQDTAIPGSYMANWSVAFPGGGIMSFPTVGYMWCQIEESLASAGALQLISLPDVKEYLHIDPANRVHDHQLTSVIEGIRPQVEHLTGPIIPQTFEEWHDGGQYFIQLRRRPSTGYGTSPILTLIGCEEFRGPSRYPLAIVADPSAAGVYSVHMDRLGKVTRRTSGGGVTAFPAMAESVHVWYQAGQAQVPANVRQACLEIVRINFRDTEAVGRGRLSEADTEQATRGPFVIPPSIERQLAPTCRAPAIA